MLVIFTLVTGGSGSGKSEYAENLAVSYKSRNLIYIATMQPFGGETLKKIERHKKMRKNKNFKTIEAPVGIDKIEIPDNASVLLDCMSNLVANEIYDENGAKDKTAEEILKGINKIKDKAENLIVVTNEVFSDGISYDRETEKYKKILGKINQNLAQQADQIIEVVYSIPLKVK